MIIRGDARRIPLRAGVVQTVVTSPPYWGLRRYPVEPLVWDGADGCVHEWRLAESVIKGSEHGDAVLLERGGPLIEAQATVKKYHPGAWCEKCGAWLGQLGLEPSPELFVAHVVEVMREARRVLRPDGTVWLVLGDSYSSGNRSTRDIDRKLPARGVRFRAPTPPGLKPKDLVGIPWMVAFALQADGWYLRSAIVWAKTNCLPESVRDRPTRSYEHVFLLAKSANYFYDGDAIRQPLAESSIRRISQPTFDGQRGGVKDYRSINPNRSARHALENLRARVARDDEGASLGRNRHDVWTIPCEPLREEHYAAFPAELAAYCIMAGTSEAGACAACGAPYRRLVEVAYRNPGNRGTNGPRSLGNREHTAGFRVRLEREARTAGWQVSCDCCAPRVPCLVLDPFLGSGTVGLAAERLGRRWVGVELAEEYVKLARRRTAQMGLGLVAPTGEPMSAVMADESQPTWPAATFRDGVERGHPW